MPAPQAGAMVIPILPTKEPRPSVKCKRSPSSAHARGPSAMSPLRAHHHGSFTAHLPRAEREQGASHREHGMGKETDFKLGPKDDYDLTEF